LNRGRGHKSQPDLTDIEAAIERFFDKWQIRPLEISQIDKVRRGEDDQQQQKQAAENDPSGPFKRAAPCRNREAS
jgi:hypothetical protein